ncbi:hypothetical protein [Psychrobacillus vulpis]|uniref:Aspartate/glutamate racemase family protein n=1 Tax=Psychrobacillus vulpis TaxID=2325572 RepID=A0A544TT70_9BACI|nr:hypothetical protein [Psychrobacillus vulpis]TQR20634.1 hypothetical protein FG384_05930 [Psychrobacillus vulpis]
MKLACLHAHYSNIDYIESALSSDQIELIHFVDPGLMNLLTSDGRLQKFEAQNKVNEQIEWIAKSNIDAILITCTNYIALLNDSQLSESIPIIKIDEPFFEVICNIKDSQVIFFTNAATVSGTMERLHQYAKSHQKELDVEAFVIDNAFELLMRGLKEEYNQEVSKSLKNAIKDGKKVISVAQLSMVQASTNVENETSTIIINPLNALVTHFTT